VKDGGGGGGYDGCEEEKEEETTRDVWWWKVSLFKHARSPNPSLPFSLPHRRRLSFVSLFLLPYVYLFLSFEPSHLSSLSHMNNRIADDRARKVNQRLPPSDGFVSGDVMSNDDP